MKMARFIVLDIVFYAGSLNYDQGASNYQELKKITLWNGKQHTFVSRYALRYSLLKTGEDLGLWKTADASKFIEAGGGAQKVIQPSDELLKTGEILRYPEFDLFGYLITNTDPQNSREAPVKISHAISLTPFHFDTPFYANIGLAARYLKKSGKMSPNIFNSEEHYTFYQYTVVIDVDRIGTVDVFLKKFDEKTRVWEGANREIKPLPEGAKKPELYHIKFELKGDLEEARKKRIKSLINALLNLKRSIKGRVEDLSPVLFVFGLYKDRPYKSYRDSIDLLNELISEEMDEVVEREENGKKIYEVRHITRKTVRPKFRISGVKVEAMEYDVSKLDSILSLVDKLFESQSSLEEVRIYHKPNVEVVFS